MLRADAEANGGGRDVLLLQFVGRHLRVRSCIGMDDQALDIGHVGQEGENLQFVDELPGFGLSALYLEGEDGTATLREVLII